MKKASEDLHWTAHPVCFLAQQVAEKALKAFAYAQGEEIVLGHSVERLCAEAAAFQPEFGREARSWKSVGRLLRPHALAQQLAGWHPG